MFRIVDFRNVGGKIRMVIETDDLIPVLMLRLFSQAEKFAQLFHYRVTSEARFHSSQKTKPVKMAQMRLHRAEILKRFRDIPSGSRQQKLKILQELSMLEGIRITQDRLSAQLQIALKEEKEGKVFKVKRLIRKGITIEEIASALNLSKSTVARIARSLKGSTQSPSLTKGSVLAIAECPPEASSSKKPALPPTLSSVRRLNRK